MRVTIHLLGGPPSSGYALVIPAGVSLADVLQRAAAKLSALLLQQIELRRIFTAAGAEITDADEIMHDDVLYFSQGEDFPSSPSAHALAAAAAAQAAADEDDCFDDGDDGSGCGAGAGVGADGNGVGYGGKQAADGAGRGAPPSYSPNAARAAAASAAADIAAAAAAAAAALHADDANFAGDNIDGAEAGAGAASGSGVPPRGVLRTLASSAASLASVAYIKASSYLKEAGPPAVRDGLSEWEARVGPSVARAVARSGPALDWADAQLVSARRTLGEKRDEFMASDAGRSLRQAVADVAAAGATTAESFYQTATEAFETVRARGVEGGSAVAEHLSLVRARLGAAWDEQLAPAARGVYEFWQLQRAAAAQREESQFAGMRRDEAHRYGGYAPAPQRAADAQAAAAEAAAALEDEYAAVAAAALAEVEGHHRPSPARPLPAPTQIAAPVRVPELEPTSEGAGAGAGAGAGGAGLMLDADRGEGEDTEEGAGMLDLD
jgi:hypothetical protein